MKIAVVAPTVDEAVRVAASLGMTRTSLPLRAEVSPLLGERFTGVLILKRRAIGDSTWWLELLRRTEGPIYTLDEWGTS